MKNKNTIKQNKTKQNIYVLVRPGKVNEKGEEGKANKNRRDEGGHFGSQHEAAGIFKRGNRKRGVIAARQLGWSYKRNTI